MCEVPECPDHMLQMFLHIAFEDTKSLSHVPKPAYLAPRVDGLKVKLPAPVVPEISFTAPVNGFRILKLGDQKLCLIMT